MKQNKEHKYDDIIMLPHHVSQKHPQMPLLSRAAQFSSFAALTGHSKAVKEAARLTDAFVELDESRKDQLNEQLCLIRENLEYLPEIEVVCFQPDNLKSGGTYEDVKGRVKKIDEYSRQIIFTDGRTLPIENIFSIRGELFKNMDWLDI